MSSPTSVRSTYRHGDLRQALLDAGVEMARSGGPDAVVLREATRRAGVSPNAAYRHFADREALVQAVSDTAQGFAADRMAEAIARITPTGSAAGDARLRLRAVGSGYLRFARDEPGLFRAAFSVPTDLGEALRSSKRGAGGRTPFETLSSVLDELLAAGVLPPERRPGAELLAWSSVHGLGMLIIDGPLRGLDDQTVEYATEHLLDLVDRGI
ncbi:TetR/AcrR family transcriptional regulator [Plantibacter flavus]|uniref:TetR/AcrR family transcriptional regulator n=1 Tax=Plantibacter flavus TaxID=150123 RepID=UPI003F1406D6